jgi:hypothetical protein
MKPSFRIGKKVRSGALFFVFEHINARRKPLSKKLSIEVLKSSLSNIEDNLMRFTYILPC